MPPVPSSLDLTRPIDPTSATWGAIAETLQGNIAKPHGREYTVMLLFVLGDGAKARAGLASVAGTFVTSARQQSLQGEQRAENPTTVLGNLGLSAGGYRKLGFTEQQLEKAFAQRYDRNWFLDGMGAKAVALGDAAGTLEQFYQDEKLDGYLLLACADAAALQQACQSARTALNGFCTAIQEEPGRQILRDGKCYEPFGFRDAIAMPGIFDTTASDKQPADTLLFRDRLAQDPSCFGTFVVYRKLEQDVAGFKQAAQGLATALGSTPDDAAALVVGRRQDGTLLIPDFSHDPGGNVCPFHAHVRKVNPQTTVTGNRVNIPLYRRATPYAADEKQGLLFLAMQANLGAQFGMLVRTWMNSPDFPVPGTGTDSLLGTPGGTQDWKGKSYDVGRHVTFRGGEFFFLPSLAFLRSLSA
jgi:Dyp-type peroxidase family